MESDKRFVIDFFEFSFLVEACIPPVPIARHSFWLEVINRYYNILNQGERKQLFNWIQKNGRFDLKNDDCRLFYDRFDPSNQYEVTLNIGGRIEKQDCFFHRNEYYISSNVIINEDFIVGIRNKYYEQIK